MFSKFKSLFFISIISLAIFLSLDFIFGKFLLEKFYWKDKEDFRVEHDIFHHTIKPNYNGPAYFGGKKYKFCSDASGFKSSCKNVGVKTKNFDIVIIGDSFTEGLGIPYEKTFVGIIDEKLKNKKIANLAVSGYSVSIYYIKIKEFLKKGYSFDEVIIYVDLNDIFNEASSYKIVNNKVVPMGIKKQKVDYLENNNKKKKNFKKFFRENFTFTYENLHLIKIFYYRIKKKDIFPYVTNLEMAAWPYEKNLNSFGEMGVENAILKAQKIILDLMDLLDRKNIDYSIGVYPYAQSMFKDKVDSRHVKIWKKICENRCKNFYNNFPEFFKISSEIGPIETYYRYFIYRDTHFNEEGHKLIADNFLENYNNILNNSK